MAFSPDQIISADTIELPVADTPSVSRMIILTGTVAFSLKGDSADTWRRETISFPIGKLSGEMVKGMGLVSLASVCNTDAAGGVGWAVDQVRIKHDTLSMDLRLEADLAIRDADGYIERLSYMAFVMAKV